MVDQSSGMKAMASSADAFGGAYAYRMSKAAANTAALNLGVELGVV